MQFEQDGKTYGASYGIAQIRNLPGRPDPSWLLSPINNMEYARQLYMAHGWQPWTCSKIVGKSKELNPGKIADF